MYVLLQSSACTVDMSALFPLNIFTHTLFAPVSGDGVEESEKYVQNMYTDVSRRNIIHLSPEHYCEVLLKTGLKGQTLGAIKMVENWHKTS